jgi:hypothetical protein
MFDPASAIIMGGATLLGSVLGFSGASKEADAQTSAANAEAAAEEHATDIQNQQWQQTQKNLSPWMQAGQGALGKLSSLAGNEQFNFSTTGANADPSYQWRLQQGQDALAASAAAKGGYFSGATGEALTEDAQNTASQEYQNQYNRWMNTQQQNWNELSSLSSGGQNAAAGLGGLGAQYASAAGQNAIGAAQAQGAGQIGAANAYSGALTNTSNQLMSGAGQYSQYQLMNNYLNNGSYTNPSVTVRQNYVEP